MKNRNCSSTIWIWIWTQMANKALDMWNWIKHKNKKEVKTIGNLAVPKFLHPKNIRIDNSAPIFPPEVMIGILTRLPLKTLMRFQVVCKNWRALLNDIYFIEKHMERSDIVHYWFNVHRDSNSNPKHESFSYVHGCDGLVLVQNNTSRKYCLWNPAAHRVLELPDPHIGSHEISFSYVPAAKSYKIVSFYRDKESAGEGCEVFTPGSKSKLWKQLPFPDSENSNRNRERDLVSLVTSGGAAHYVVLGEVGKESNVEIVSLDLETENFTVNHFPKKLLRQVADWKNFWDLDWDGKFAFVDIVGQNMEVVELEDYKSQRWCKKKKVVPLPFMEKVHANELQPLFVREGDIWFWLKDKEIFTYTMASGKYSVIRQEPTFSPMSKLYPYRPSLINFEGMVPDTKLQRLYNR